MVRRKVQNKGFPHSSDGKESACNAGGPGSIPGSGRSPGGGNGRSPGEGNGNPLQYPRLENPMDRGNWQAIQSMGWQKLDTTERLNHKSPQNKEDEISTKSSPRLLELGHWGLPSCFGWSVRDRSDREEEETRLPDPGLPVSKAGHFRGPRQLPQDTLKKLKRPGRTSEGG